MSFLCMKDCHAPVLLLILTLPILSVGAARADDQICNVAADLALGLEDYPTTITLHQEVLRAHPDNALAHYHLGFAYGMRGNVADEIHEYREAISLGLHKWDLFLNLGLAYFDQQDLTNATVAFTNAIMFGPEHAEAHFNLAIAYERQGRLENALSEIEVSRRLAPDNLEVGNTNGVICAELQNFSCARHIWTQLVQSAPFYRPARENLAILNTITRTNGLENRDPSPDLEAQPAFVSDTKESEYR